ncbi:MAG: hypothetical protein AB7G75_12775 [Candidatus Binatia bacterium]
MPGTVQEFWRPIINDFNPVGRVRFEDVQRFFVDRHEEDPTRSIIQRLKVNLQNSLGQPAHYKGLLTGHVGSGKSSELLRLGQELVNDFFVVWFDAETTLATETANHFDILLAMGLAVHRVAAFANLDPDTHLADDFVKSFAKMIRKFEGRKGFSLKLDQVLKQVTATALGFFGVSQAVATVTDNLLGATRLELKVGDEQVRNLELPANREEIIGALNSIIAAVREKAGKPLLIIADGLDKVPALRAKHLFSDSALLTEPACALLYAAPIEFYHRLIAGHVTNLFNEYRILSNPAVQKRPATGEYWKNERERNEHGLSVMREVVAKRLAMQHKTTDEILTAPALDLLALNSGGVMRELIRSIRDAATFAQLLEKTQIDETIAHKVIAQQRQEVASRLSKPYSDTLRSILQQGALSGGTQESIEDELLRSLYLLSYQDAIPPWFDVHPNVLPVL